MNTIRLAFSPRLPARCTTRAVLSVLGALGLGAPLVVQAADGAFDNLTVSGTATVGGNATFSGSGTFSGPLTLLGSHRVTGASFPNLQGAYIGWNRSGGVGETNFVNNKGTGQGGFTFDNTADGSTFTNLMTISSLGRVGIGTQSPALRLDIEGAAVNGASTAVLRVGTNDVPYGGSGGAIEFAGAVNGGSTAAYATIASYITNGTAGAHYGDMVLRTATAGALTEKMRILGTGNVGIGTSSPDQSLVVNGAIKSILGKDTYFPTKNVAAIVDLGTSGITGAYNWSLRGVYQYAGGVNVNAAGGDLDLIKALNGQTILATKSDGTALGNVGIGTTSPTAQLTQDGSGNGIFYQALNSTVAASRGGLVFSRFNNYNSPALIGLGNNLFVDNTANFARQSSADAGLMIEMTNIAGAGGVTPRFGFHSMSSTGVLTTLMTMNGNGNVGIGTGLNTPTAKLEVAGTAKISSDLDVSGELRVAASKLRIGGAIFNPSDYVLTAGGGAVSVTSLTTSGALTAGGGTLTGSATTGLTVTAGAADKNIVFATTGTGNTLFNGGNVGVGVVTSTYMTSSNGTQYKLSVEGKIHAKEVVVDSDAASWSDYVFAANYRNAPLAEVEQHIKEHGHLPGIPSASEVEQKGVNLGQMQALLLAKVEELTLHLIEQEKHAKAQETRLVEQTDRLVDQDQRLARLEQENAALRAAR